MSIGRGLERRKRRDERGKGRTIKERGMK